MLNNKQQRINVNINTLKSITCPKCECVVFETGFGTFKKLSAVQSPTGQEQLIAINLVKCCTCGSFFMVEGNKLTFVLSKDL